MNLLAKFQPRSEPPESKTDTPTAKVSSPIQAPRSVSLLARLGKSEVGLPEGVTPLGTGVGVTNTRDLNRILELPRRQRPDEAATKAMAETLKRRLGNGTVLCECVSKYKNHCCADLLPVQAWALTEAEQVGGLLGPIGVGHGKTLLDLLTPVVVKDCKVAVLLLPPNLKAQLLEVDWKFYGQHWKLPNLAQSGGRPAKWVKPGRPLLHVVAYTELSSAKNSDLLSRIKPDTIICDEAHSVRNRTASRTKRFLRYLNENPLVRLFSWSGTLTSRSLKDYAHLSNHALREGSPTPTHYPVVEEWAAALDPTDFRKPPGSLLKFCAPGERVADGYRRRLVETTGVVTSPDNGGCGASLIISEYKVSAPERVLSYLKGLEETAERPDGEQLVDQLQVATAAKQLACGFFYRWRWPRKEPREVIEAWLAARKDWHKELRESLKHSSEHMDSPLLLTKAAIRWHDGYVHIERDAEGREIQRISVPPHTKKGPMKVWASEHWPLWRKLRDTAQPETEAVWVDDYLVKACAVWLKTVAKDGGLLWYEYKAFGEALRAMVPEAVYCGPGDEGNQRVLALTGAEACIMSIKAHGTGKNLQKFSKNLIANPPSDGATWEQMLGRTHRTGQMADEITAEVFRHTDAMRAAVEKARELSSYISGTFGAKQKLVDVAQWMF